MRIFLIAIILFFATPILAQENIVYDDGTGAQISFSLPVYGKHDGNNIEYKTFRIIVKKEEKYLLFSDLAGVKDNDGKMFIGKIIIPSVFVDSAEIIMLGSPSNSSLGVTKRLEVSSFRKVKREKSWTEQD